MQIDPFILKAIRPLQEKGAVIELATFDDAGLNGTLDATRENTIGIIRNRLTGKMIDFFGFRGSEVFHSPNMRGTIRVIAELMETGPSTAVH